MPLPREQVYTTDDIYALPDGERAELIDGQIYMMGTPSRIHQKLAGQLSRIIGNYIESIMVPVRFILLLLQSLLRKMIKTMLNQISV